ncbi:MAG: DEAD/DEAH box helicase [Bacteroidales bacterium]|nr:DEAD/DEAH box helicase [Bacteroidales bacterium]
MTFDELNIKKYFKTNLRELGLRDLTLIQERAFPAVMSGRDVMGIAQTGTGKTIAYLLPSLNLWKFTPRHEPQIIILVPTRELVLQVEEEVKKLAKDSGIMVVGVFGGAGIQPQAARIREGADVVVGTPGRVLDIALHGLLRFGGVRRLILDEVDEMLEQGFRNQIGRVLDLLPRRRQNLMFSATMTDEIEQLADTFFNGPMKIEAAPMGTPLENIHQTVMSVPNFNTKINVLANLISSSEEMKRTMVFVSTIAMADEVFDKLSKRLAESGVGISLDYLHSRRTQSQRFSTLRSFRDGETDILIATDLIARGIDIEGVSHVICFDLPFEPEQYIHRIGRTGRVRLAHPDDENDTTIVVDEGHALSFCTPAEETALVNIEGLMKTTVERVPMPEGIEISDVLIEAEMPQIRMRNSLTELDATPGKAFHERSEKNQKTNHRVSHRTLMRQKYGKPIKRRPKK